MDRKVVLVVDDDDALRRAVLRGLSGLGVDLREASNGQEALDLLRGGLKPALILSDIDMPCLTGLELAERCRSEFPSVVFILTSGGGHKGKADALGIRYLPKPCEIPVLKATVSSVL